MTKNNIKKSRRLALVLVAGVALTSVSVSLAVREKYSEYFSSSDPDVWKKLKFDLFGDKPIRNISESYKLLRSGSSEDFQSAIVGESKTIAGTKFHRL